MNIKMCLLSLLFACFLIGGAASVAEAQKDYCFEKNGKEFQQRVSMTITKNKVEGTFESGGYQPDTSAETFDFTGTKSGNNLTIKFDNRPPYQLPPGTKKIVWTLGAATLKLPIYGKNFNAKKSENYTVAFGICKEN